MPTELRNNQHELLSPDGALSLLFGTEDTGYLTTTYPAIDAGDQAVGDVARVREDGVAFGEDYLSGKTWTFEVGVLTNRALNPERAGGDALGDLEGAWTDPRFRNRSSGYAILRSNVGGRLVRCYGRPRRYVETAGTLTNRGYTPVVMDFTVADGRWYSDDEQAATITLLPPTDGGLKAPLVAPLSTTGTGIGGDVMRVGGKKSTWPVVTFYGPVTNPQVTIGDQFVVGLRTSILTGMHVTVDPRPWVRSAVKSDGSNQGGALSAETPPMRRCLVPPGVHRLTYKGVDPSRTSWCSVTWRDAYPRP